MASNLTRSLPSTKSRSIGSPLPGEGLAWGAFTTKKPTTLTNDIDQRLA
jgi:hypothetical protein